MASKKILIVGGGMAGMCLAAFLEKLGLDYIVIDKTSDWKRQGFEVAVWKNGRDILKKLGLTEQFDACGEKARFECLRDGAGGIIRSIPFRYLTAVYGSAVTVIARSKLHDLLVSCVDPLRIKTGASITNISEHYDGVFVTFADTRVEKYDVVVGADGIHSSVRNLAYKVHEESCVDWRAWYFWIDNSFHHTGELATYVEPGQVATLFGAQGRTMVFLFAPQVHGEIDEVATRIDRLKARFSRLSGLVPKIFEGVNAEDIIVGDLSDVSLPVWYTARTVLIGDAAHSLGPTAGMGCSMAFEDAYVLASELYKYHRGTQTLVDAFAAYESHQRPRIQDVYKVTQEIRYGTMFILPYIPKLLKFVFWVAPSRFVFRHLEPLFAKEI